MRYFLSVFCGILAASLIYTLAFYLSLGRTASKRAALFSEMYHAKEAVAAKLESPRIVIVSGSNGLYGMGAKQIEDVTGIPAVNLATNAGFTRDYLFYRAKKVLRKGDTVIIPLEYEFYFTGGVNAVHTDFILAVDRDYFLRMPVAEQMKWVMSTPFESLKDRVLTSRAEIEKIAKVRAEKTAGLLNERGDYIANDAASQSAVGKLRIASSKPVSSLVKDKWNQTEKGWRDIAAFCGWCKDHGILVFASFPSSIRRDEYEERRLAAATRYLSDGYAKLGVPMLGSVEAFLFEKEDFYDTHYHLNRAAAVRRTDIFLNYLEPHLQSIRENGNLH